MNKIHVDVDFTNGTLDKKGIDLITGDYASTEIEFTFDEEHSTGRKTFEMKSPNDEVVFVGDIEDNKILLAGKDENENNVSLFEYEGYYIFEVSYYEENSKLTSVYGKIPVRKEQVVIGDEIVEPYLPIFDELIQEVDTKISEMESAMQGVENLNVEAEKVDHTTTITITKKDGTSYDVKVLDGEKGEKGEKGDAGAIKMLIVAELPSTGADDTIYLLPIPKIEVNELPSTGEPKTIYIVIGTGKRYIYESEQWVEVTNDNNYFEYVYINNKWEELGEIGVQVDLSNYYTKQETYSKTETDTLLNGKANTSDIPDLTDYVKNTDYANSQKGGVIKIASAFGYSISNYNNGIYPLARTYAQYQSDLNETFIGKGTLENVIAGKGLTTKAYVDNLVGDIGTVLDNINGEVI